MNYLSLNGEIIEGNRPVLMPDNRAFRYGEGLFETMKVIHGKIPLQEYHFQRLLAGVKMLQLKTPASLSKEMLITEILHICQLNHCIGLARVRLTVFGGNGIDENGESGFQYLIECEAANEQANMFNEKGFVIGLYPDAKKSCDKFSNLKSANYLPCLMAAKHSKNIGTDDCLILNTYNRISEASIANVFLIKDKQIITPLLSEGCVDGVMRKYLVEQLISTGDEVLQRPVTEHDIENADEIFLTNAIYGIRWVRQFEEKKYEKIIIEKIYNQFIQPIWQ